MTRRPSERTRRSAALLAPYLRAYISGDTRTRDERVSLLAKRSGLSVRAVKRILRAEPATVPPVPYFEADALLVEANAVRARFEDPQLAALRVAGVEPELPQQTVTDKTETEAVAV